MASRDNSLGKPLAEAAWLEAHHRAKLPERLAFAKRLAGLQPSRVVDLGCATGLWLELLDDLLPNSCEFIGVDMDDEALEHASERAARWQRASSFLRIDIETEARGIPPADLTLAFNVFSYVSDLPGFIRQLANRAPRGVLAVRQYDGASIRFGPMATVERQQLESDLRVAAEFSQRFRHYDLDRTFNILRSSPFEHGSYDFELFARTSPFPEEFMEYYTGTLAWTRDLLSPAAAARLSEWMATAPTDLGRYFYEVDLVALLS